MDRLTEIEARLKAAWRPDTYVPARDQSRWGQGVVSITRCRDKPLTTLEFMPHTMGDTAFAEMLANAGEDLWFMLDRVRALEAGLRFYADELNYEKAHDWIYRNPDEGEIRVYTDSPVQDDSGQRAKTALAGRDWK